MTEHTRRPTDERRSSKETKKGERSENVNRGKLNRFRLPMSNSIKSVFCVGTTMRNDCQVYSSDDGIYRYIFFIRLNFIDFLMLTQNSCLDKPKWLFRLANSTIKWSFFSFILRFSQEFCLYSQCSEWMKP